MKCAQFVHWKVKKKQGIYHLNKFVLSVASQSFVYLPENKIICERKNNYASWVYTDGANIR